MQLPRGSLVSVSKSAGSGPECETHCLSEHWKTARLCLVTEEQPKRAIELPQDRTGRLLKPCDLNTQPPEIRGQPDLQRQLTSEVGSRGLVMGFPYQSWWWINWHLRALVSSKSFWWEEAGLAAV